MLWLWHIDFIDDPIFDLPRFALEFFNPLYSDCELVSDLLWPKEYGKSAGVPVLSLGLKSLHIPI